MEIYYSRMLQLFIFVQNTLILIKMTKPVTKQSKPAKPTPIVAVISGPSGVGKDAAIARMKEIGAHVHYVVTATTRSKRHNEKEGIHYHFLTTRQFKNRIANNEFLEYAEVYGNYYGVLIKEVKSALQKGADVIIKVDVQGAATLKKKIPAATFIFLLPESLEDLAERLKRRNVDSSSDMAMRLSIAKKEIKEKSWFDYTVTNVIGNLDDTAEKIKAIIAAEKCRVKLKKVAF